MDKQMKRRSTSKRATGSLGLNTDKNKLKDWDCGPGYTVEKILGQGSYGTVAQAT